jgi:hypothetical protein
MSNTETRPTATKPGDRLRAEAAAAERRREESFDRCDTDGFLSQWANGIDAQLKRANADILDNGGLAEFPCLLDATTGARVDAKLVEVTNRYTHGKEMKWVLAPGAERFYGRKWIPSGARSRIQKQLGLMEGAEMAPAVAVTAGGGKGLSGACSVYIKIVRRAK